jgi:hypothetical protein
MNIQIITAMSEIRFNLTPIDEKPSRRYRKGSKYDPVLDRFMDRAAKLVEVSMEGKDANYLRTQLNKRIEAKRLEGIKVSVVNNVCYLEKT